MNFDFGPSIDLDSMIDELQKEILLLKADYSRIDKSRSLIESQKKTLEENEKYFKNNFKFEALKNSLTEGELLVSTVEKVTGKEKPPNKVENISKVEMVKEEPPHQEPLENEKNCCLRCVII